MDIKISLAAARVNAQLTQKEVARMIGVSNNTILAWEKGKSEPSVSQARELSRIYKIPYDFIFLPDVSN